jgi:hypothetical protein
VIPPIAFLAGAVVLYLGFQKWKKPVKEIVEETSRQAEKDEYISQLEDELKNRN